MSSRSLFPLYFTSGFVYKVDLVIFWKIHEQAGDKRYMYVAKYIHVVM